MVRTPAPRRQLNPFLLRRAAACNINQGVLSNAAGFPAYSTYYNILRSPIVIASAKTVGRLMRLADLLDFPRDEVFLDEPSRPVKQAGGVDAEAAR